MTCKPLAALAALVTLLATACGGASSASPAASSPLATGSAAAKAAPSAAPVSGQTAASRAAKLTVSYSAIIANNLPEWMADAAGYFKQNGLNVELTYIESSKGIPALLSGETQVSNLGGSEAMAAVVGGADLLTVTNNAPVYSFILQVPATITKPEDLKGKKLGVSQFGSASDIALRVALKKINIDPDKDVSVLAVGSASTRLAAMESGAIQGGMSFPPESLFLEAKGFHTLVDLAALKAPSNIGTANFNRSYLSANRPTVQKYVDSVVQGIARARKDKALTIEVLKKYHKSDDTAAMDKTYDFFVNEVIPQYPLPKPEQWADSVAVLGEKNDKIKTFDVSKMLDDSFVKSAQERGVDKQA
jgi:NitT/TauT family transport system substrate-binding protein